MFKFRLKLPPYPVGIALVVSVDSIWCLQHYSHLEVVRRTAQTCGSGPIGLCPHEQAALNAVDQPVSVLSKCS